ncbi:AAA family ATPase [Aliarcobacter butzleri]|uniref:AAA family ATPase n=1 Tax=Aliarcobacter butzleri TaxID=28197 RepID=UPI0021B443B4|nr:AAA family ATPase [Aliarcobacter butzleri]MCT7553641.1 AAA family ATPase [Aliarcobacter butzleri]
MIRQIKNIKNFGIFKNFLWTTDLLEFKKFNLFYGWNGSGKTTLSKLFTMLEQKHDLDLLKNLTNYEFSILEEDNKTITNKNYQSNDLKLFVYNEIFKERNIDWNNVIKSILLISDTLITEKTELNEKKALLGSDDKSTTILGKIRKNIIDTGILEKSIDDFYSKSAKSIKEEFKIIDTSDTYYFNYNKTKFQNFLETNLQEVQKKSNKLDAVEVNKLKEAIKPDILNKIELDLKKIELTWLEKVQERILGVVKTSLIVNEVQRLKEHPQIGKWVEDGIKIHNFYNSSKCEFCNQELPLTRLEELEKHFSDKFIKLKEKIQSAIDWLPQQKISYTIFENDLEFYPEFQEEFKEIKKLIKASIDDINELFDLWMKSLVKKSDNPFEIIEEIEKISSDKVKLYNNLIDKLEGIRTKHNYKTDNFEKESRILKSKLELHYATTLYDDFDLKKKEKSITKYKDDLTKLIEEKEELKTKIKELEVKLSDEAFGAKEFNKKLHKFLGRDNIFLEFDKELQGYKIIRDGLQASNLSEGERTAIAFVYFITKIKENENKVEDSIIIVDDPISSFDSNNLFSAYSFLKNECEKAKQLFVITHNFAYFKLIRDWFLTKNKKKNSTTGNLIIKSNFYMLETEMIQNTRYSNIKNVHNTLINYQSEYHFIFSKLYNYKDFITLEVDKAYLIGNLSRKLLEAFLSFKYPKKRNDFRALMDVGIEDKEMLEKVYKFINKYSHNQNIEFYDSSDDNVLSESINIVRDILEEIVKKIDPKHYEEMVEIISG